MARTVKDVLSYAHSQLGVSGGSKYNRWIGKSVNEAWCATFVSWCFYKAGASKASIKSPSAEAFYTKSGSVSSKSPAGVRIKTNHARPGDLILYDWKGTVKGVNHIGFVYSYDDKTQTLITIEGNTGGGSGKVAKPDRSSFLKSGEVYAIVRPYYTDSTFDPDDLADITDPDEASPGGDGSSQIDYTQLEPYLITIKESTPDIDLKAMKNNKVIGALLEAGWLFTKSHNKKSNFRTSKLYTRCQQCLDVNLPFAYIMYGRAVTVKEAEEEMYELSFLVRKYPPMLGVWIYLEIDKKKETVDKILALYQKELIRLGLKNKIGIHCNRTYLKKFSWNKFQNDWYLWLDAPVKSTSELNTLLDPEFFDTDNKSGTWDV